MAVINFFCSFLNLNYPVLIESCYFLALLNEALCRSMLWTVSSLDFTSETKVVVNEKEMM